MTEFGHRTCITSIKPAVLFGVPWLRDPPIRTLGIFSPRTHRARHERAQSLLMLMSYSS
jgi:hypothetical protein